MDLKAHFIFCAGKKPLMEPQDRLAFLEALADGDAASARAFRDKYGDTVLDVNFAVGAAAATQHETAMSLLLDMGANINAPLDEGGRTLLMCYAELESDEHLRWLLDHGANPLLRDKEGRRAQKFSDDRFEVYSTTAEILAEAEKKWTVKNAAALTADTAVFPKPLRLRKKTP